jgi:LuxR family maltose regulon positive regulatory protein
MSQSILSTKLFMPTMRPNLIERSRLIDRLDNGVRQGCPLTLVSAPAGFGKTTLVSEWISATGPDHSSVAWISLDEMDNDLPRFLLYLITAFQQIDPAFGQAIRPAILSSPLPPAHELVTLLINDLAKTEKNFLLVLDDYHQIISHEVHQVVQLLLERQPITIHTVIITREDPPFPLPRMRVRGQMTEIRERDLRFSRPEAEAFFVNFMGLDLPPKTITILETRTEGWIAGLQLAALAIQEFPDEESTQGFLETFAGTDRHIVDYLVEEVYTRQPMEVQEFLLRTSILERFCAPLCDALIENGEPGGNLGGNHSASASFLLKIERANLFLIPLDNQRKWYRYHHLFADLLQHLLFEYLGSQVTDLHRRASQWLEANNFLQEAVNHAIKTKDWAFAGELVERHAMDLIVVSQVNTLHQWCTSFPEQVIRSRPGLCIFSAWCLVLTFRADFRNAVAARLQQAEQALREQDLPAYANLGPRGVLVPLQEWVVGHICAIRSQLLLAAINDPVDPQAVIDISLKSLELLPEAEKPIRSTCAITLAHAYLMLGDIPNVEKALSKALELAWDGDNYFTAVTAFFYRARVAYLQGHLRRADEICQEGLARLLPLFEHPEQDFPAIRSLYVMQGLIQLEWNHLDEAERLLSLGANMTGWAPWVEVIGYTALVRLWEIRGQSRKVAEVLDLMKKVGLQHAICAEALGVQYQIWHFPEDRNIQINAEAWSDANPQIICDHMVVMGIGPYQVDAEYIVYLAWLYVQIALGRPEAAIACAVPVLMSAEKKGLRQRMIELTIVQVLGLASTGDLDQAVERLRSILPLAEPQGFLRIFDRGLVLDELLVKAARHDNYRATVQKVLAAFGRIPGQGGEKVTLSAEPDDHPVPADQILTEPLSKREIEVLRLIAEGYSNDEIGKRLYIAYSTVKRHINNIFGKFGVKSRTQAVQTGRNIGLLK